MKDLVKTIKQPMNIASLYPFFSLEYQKQRFCSNLEDYQYVYRLIETGASLEQYHQFVKDSDIILAVPMTPYMDREFLKMASGVKLVQFLSTGYDNIDIDAATELGIAVANNAGINSVAVAEHAFMMILMLLKKAIIGHNSIRQGKWIQNELVNENQFLRELKGKTLGILGLGNIGTELAKRGKAFDATVIYNKRNRLTKEKELALGVEYRSFNELLEESDVLSIHVPLTEETYKMIGAPQLEQMKDNAILINTARADVIDEKALVEALKQNKLAGAGIDVPRSHDTVEEFSHLFAEVENVVLTPHVASATYNCANLFWEQAAENICKAVNGEKPKNLVNDVWKM